MVVVVDAFEITMFPFAIDGALFVIVLTTFVVAVGFLITTPVVILKFRDIDLVGSNAGALLDSVDEEAIILALDLVGDEVTDAEEGDTGVLLPLLLVNEEG